MAFQVTDYHDLVRLLQQHPEWREELRHLLLTADVLELPQVVRELAEAQRQLVEAQRRSEERLTRLEQTVAELAEAQKKTEEQMQKLTERVNSMTDELSELRGDMLEMRYRQRAFSYFGKIVSRAQVVDLQEIWSDKIEPRLNAEEREDLLSLDLLVRGRLNRALEERTGIVELWLAVEVSGVVDQNDVRRVKRRADLLGKAGLTVLPIAAGREATRGAVALASEMGVILQKDGGLFYVEEAVAQLQEKS